MKYSMNRAKCYQFPDKKDQKGDPHVWECDTATKRYKKKSNNRKYTDSRKEVEKKC